MFASSYQTRTDSTNKSDDSSPKKKSILDPNAMMHGLNKSEQMGGPQDQMKSNNSNIAQAMVNEEEEKPTQQKAIQKAANEEEEPVQGKIVQKAGMEEEEPVQGKIVQKAVAGEEEIQLKESSGNNSEATANTSSTQSSLPKDVNARMEASFGRSFSDVNIHSNDSKATQMGALAYTQGNNVHFAPGQYNPGTSKGQELIGHEYTHVVQQSAGLVTPTKQGKGMPINDSPALENEADVMGKRAAEGKAANVSGVGDGVQQKEEEHVPSHEVIDDNAGEKAQIKSAIIAAYKMVDNAQKNLGGTNKDRYKNWFDTNYTDENAASKLRFDSVAWNFIKLHSLLKGKKVKFNCSTRGGSYFAYVNIADGENLIYLGSAFWTAADTGRDSKGGTIVHELSHEELGTDDHVYGAVGASDLAKNDPGKAMTNADNYEYFAEDSY